MAVVLFRYKCDASHEGEDRGRDGPTITMHEKAWAYCSRAGYEAHRWTHLDGLGMTREQIAADLLVREGGSPA